MNAAKLSRRLHRWGAVLTALPVLVVIASGLLLQLKKEMDWIQPPTRRGAKKRPTLPFDRILEIARGVEGAGIDGWGDIDRLDVRPGRGVLKVRAKSRHEIQIDASTGDVLQVAYRRSDLIEDIHDGSFFHDRAKLWIFLPTAIVLLGLWATGVHLWLLPHLVRRRRARDKFTGKKGAAS